MKTNKKLTIRFDTHPDILEWVENESAKMGLKPSTWIRYVLIQYRTKQNEDWITKQEKR